MLNKKNAHRCLSALVILSLATASIGEVKVTPMRHVFLHGTLNGGGSECLELLNYLQEAEPLSENKFFPVSSDTEISFPRWVDLDPDKSADVLRFAYYAEHGEYPLDEKWGASIFPLLIEKIERWGGKLQKAAFDVDNNGSTETIYRLSRNIQETNPARSAETVFSKSGALEWQHFVSPEENPDLVKQLPFKTSGNDFILFNGYTYQITWGSHPSARSISAGIPKWQPHSVTGWRHLQSLQQCVFMEFYGNPFRDYTQTHY